MKERIIKSWKKMLAVFVICFGILFSINFSGNYFELSKNLDIFATLVKEVNTYYVDEIDASKLVRIGIDAMLNSLDPYTNFISESQVEDFRFMTTGEYGGIGAIISKNGDYIIVQEPYEGAPAQLADLRAGDKILEIDGKDMVGKSTSDASKLLKGQPDSHVKIVIQRPGAASTQTKHIQRKDIKVGNVPYYGMVNENTGYIQFSQFRQNAAADVRNALEELKKNPNLTSVILDVRNNPGGLLHEAVNTVNLFVKRGELVVSTKGKVQDWNRDYRTSSAPFDTEIPLVVLINENSASASEIVAGTLQDYDRAVVAGRQTFGKGLVQTTRPLSYNAQVKLTTAKYYIPSGRSIQAIDYTHRDVDGAAVRIPDSLRTPYKTRGGRVVLDGAGIEPEIKVERVRLAEITRTLIQRRLIFDYATEYRNKNNSIAPASQFRLTDKDFEDFMVFLSDKDYSYETATEKALVELQAKARDEQYFESIAKEYEAMAKKLQHDKEADIRRHKDEVMHLLTQEIVSRYHFQRGRTEVALRNDNDVQAAAKILSNKNEYNGIVRASR